MEDIKKTLKKLTNHKYIELTDRGNTAIKEAMRLSLEENLKKACLTVDQGGWFTYYKYPKKMGITVELLKTDYGVIGIKELSQELKKGYSFFIYSNPAGYYAEQDRKGIYKTCKKNNCLVIMDVTGSIGTDMCNGEYADYIVSSFGEGKPVNLGYGGFISSNKKFEMIEYFDKEYLNDLKIKLEGLKTRHESFEKINKKIKKDLNGYKILHREKRGINVIVSFDTDKEKVEIEEYCNKEKLQYTICPRYIRVKKDAVSIEVKREE